MIALSLGLAFVTTRHRRSDPGARSQEPGES